MFLDKRRLSCSTVKESCISWQWNSSTPFCLKTLMKFQHLQGNHTCVCAEYFVHMHKLSFYHTYLVYLYYSISHFLHQSSLEWNIMHICINREGLLPLNLSMTCYCKYSPSITLIMELRGWGLEGCWDLGQSTVLHVLHHVQTFKSNVSSSHPGKFHLFYRELHDKLYKGQKVLG